MTTATHSIDDLKGPGNERHHAIDWTLQRFFWLCIVAVLLAALLGYLGRGPLVKRLAVADDDSLSVEYYRVERYQSPTQLRIRVAKLPGGEQPLRLLLDKRFCDLASADSIAPPPRDFAQRGDKVVYEFDVDDADELEIVYRYQHEEPGELSYEVSVDGHSAARVSQYVLP